MIDFISIKNFRSHKDTFLDFSPGLNVITGDNDCGKTNVLRALNWVVNNRPAGDEYRSIWGGETGVELGFCDLGDGQKINRGVVKRVKTDSENLYYLNVQVFKAFGQSVPEDIKKFMNLSDVNIHFQMDGPFLLGDSPSDVAKHYNKIVNLDVIGKSIKNIAATLRQERADLGSELSREKQLEEKINKFKWVDEAEGKLIELEKQDEIINNIIQQEKSLANMVSVYGKFVFNIDVYSHIISYEREANRLFKLNEKIDKLDDNFDELNKLRLSLQRCIIEHSELKKMTALEGDFLKTFDLFSDLQGKLDEKRFLAQMIIKLQSSEISLSGYTKILGLKKIVDATLSKDTEIENKIEDLNILQKLCNSYDAFFDIQQSKQDKIEDLINQLDGFKTEICPIYDVPCEYVKNEKTKKLRT